MCQHYMKDDFANWIFIYSCWKLSEGIFIIWCDGCWVESYLWTEDLGMKQIGFFDFLTLQKFFFFDTYHYCCLEIMPWSHIICSLLCLWTQIITLPQPYKCRNYRHEPGYYAQTFCFLLMCCWRLNTALMMLRKFCNPEICICLAHFFNYTCHQYLMLN